MGMVAPVFYTVDMVRKLPEDGHRYEVVHGELLVTPAPRPWHEVIVGRLHAALASYVRDHGAGHVFAGRSEISWGADVLVEPDVFVVPLEQARTLDWKAMRDLLLVSEVLSPSSVRADRYAFVDDRAGVTGLVLVRSRDLRAIADEPERDLVIGVQRSGRAARRADLQHTGRLCAAADDNRFRFDPFWFWG